MTPERKLLAELFGVLRQIESVEAAELPPSDTGVRRRSKGITMREIEDLESRYVGLMKKINVLLSSEAS